MTAGGIPVIKRNPLADTVDPRKRRAGPSRNRRSPRSLTTPGTCPDPGMTSSMVAWLLRLGLLSGIYLVEIGQVPSDGASRSPSVATATGAGAGGSRSRRWWPIAWRCTTCRMRTASARGCWGGETGCGCGGGSRGDGRRSIRPRRRSAGSSGLRWAWAMTADERGGHPFDPAEPGSGPPTRARVVVPRAIVRSGQLGARMPGPPWVESPRGTMVQLVDRPPLRMGRGSGATLWFAVVPPAEAACYVRAWGLEDTPRREGVPEILAAYLVPEGEDPKRRAPRRLACPRGSRPRSAGSTRCTARS